MTKNNKPLMEILPVAPVVLCILDGWGYNQSNIGNAIALANAPHYRALLATCPNSLIETSGVAVGLPVGQMGNSEVGHINIGTGRIIMQDLPKIDAAIADGSFANNPVLLKLITTVKQGSGRIHILGLMSDGGVHSQLEHMIALVKVLTQNGLSVVIHAFTDGRDTLPNTAHVFLERLLFALQDVKNWQIATISGRYYAMDRDKRWDRTRLAYDAIVLGQGRAMPAKNDLKLQVITDSFANNILDEFILPHVASDYKGIAGGDAILVANFRADRVRQILSAMLDPNFNAFPCFMPQLSAASGLTEYSEGLSKYMSTLFPRDKIAGSLGELLSQNGKRQLRIAESEKYAHVTFFFNGGREVVFAGEDRVLIPSPAVKTYDLQPEMSAILVTDQLVTAVLQRKYDFIVVNYANPDMIGHTGVLHAAIQAVEAIDKCLKRLCDAVKETGGVMLITADHGNVEAMFDHKGDVCTTHTTNKVPAILFNAPAAIGLQSGRLCDIIPTLLPFIGLSQPAIMTGQSLLTAN